MSTYRLPTSMPQSLPEMWERFREYVRQTEPVVLKNIRIGTTETVVPHGLGEVPGWVGYDSPHCIAIVRQTRNADPQKLYLRATNDCVIDIRLERARPAVTTTSVANGGFKKDDWDPESVDDHLVKAMSSDSTTVGGLYEKTKSSGIVSLSVTTDGGVEKLLIDATPPDPAVESSVLYTAFVSNPLYRPNAKVILDGGVGYMFGTGWTPISGAYTWKRSSTGPLYGKGSSPRYEIQDGDIVFVGGTGDFGADKPYLGLYEVLDCGLHVIGGVPTASYAVIRRISEANTPAGLCSGMTFQIAGSGWTGVDSDGLWFTLATSDPIVVDTTNLAWTSASSSGLTDGYKLLSQAQMASEGASSESLTLSASATSETVTYGRSFQTLVGTPNVSTLPAGPVTFYIEGVQKDVPGDGDTTIVAKLYDDDGLGGTTLVVEGTSEPIWWSSSEELPERDISFQGEILADYTWSPGHTLVLVYQLVTTSTVEVAVWFKYSSPYHTTRVLVTWSNPASGYVTWDAIIPTGQAQMPLQTISVAVGGSLTLGAGNIFIVNPRWDEGDPCSLWEISTPELEDGATTWIRLIFMYPVQLQHGLASPTEGFSALYIHEAGSINNPLALMGDWGTADFTYVDGKWLLASYHSTE